MRAMGMDASAPSSQDLQLGPESGLPQISYYPPVVATLAAAVLLFLVAGFVGLVGVLTAITELTRIEPDGESGLTFGGALCGLSGIFILLAAIYFLTAVIKGVRDLGTRVYYTRGSIAPKRNIDDRKSANWLVIDPAYAGPDLAEASTITDEQRAASVDRSQIFQPRPNPTPRRWPGRRNQEIDAVAAHATKQETYLSPERISLRQDVPIPDMNEGPLAPRAVFRIDFAARTGLQPSEEVLVAHSRYLQHVYYVARLQGGEWKVYRNKALI